MHKPSFVYLKHCAALDAYKIGVSINAKKRNKSLQTGNPYQIDTLYVFESKYPYKVETILHREFHLKKTDVNEIKLKGEWFNLNVEDVSDFLNKCISIEKNIDFLLEYNNCFIQKLLF